MAKSDQSAGRRLSTITLDQALSGASNILIAILAARMFDVSNFGLFGIVFIVYVTAQGAARALVGSPLLVHPKQARERPGDAIGTACLLGLGGAAVVVAAGVVAHVWQSSLGDALVVLGVCLPLLVLQDVGRYFGFVLQQPSFSVLLDLTWLVLLFVGVWVLFATDHRTLPWFMVAWAGTGALAGLLVLARYPNRPRLSLSWLRETWAFSWRYLISYLATQGAALGASIGFGALAGTRTLGAVRAAQLLQRPVGAFQSAAVAAGVAEISPLESPTRPELRQHLRRTTALTLLVAVVSMGVLLALPDRIGEFALGDSWKPAHPLLLPAGLQMVLLAATSGTQSSLVGLRQVRTTLRIDITTVAIFLVLPLVGVAIHGATGAYWAYAVGQGVVAVIWWVLYLRHEGHMFGSTGDAGNGDGENSVVALEPPRAS